MLEFLEKEMKKMSRTESEDMRDIFVECKNQRRILELLEKGKTNEEIVDIMLGEMDH
jgi:DNA-binding CsgD family transcriptional regulator